MKLRAGFVVFLMGVAFGAAGIVYGPSLADPYLGYLPAAIRPQKKTFEGTVKAKQRETNRLLLRIETPEGAILAAFKDNVAEVDFLIGEEDTVTLTLREYKPFVEDPNIERVKKREPARSNL